MARKIMVLDDDEQIRRALLKLLQSEGYEVTLAANGAEALDKFERETIDLLLLDLSLPDKSGWDVFERITSTNPLLPIIIITGRDKQSELAAGAGVGALMEKPLDIPLLLKTIPELLLESAEARLQRLVGIGRPTHYCRAASALPPVPKSIKRVRKGPRQTHALGNGGTGV